MSALLPAALPAIPDGFVFVPQDDADVVALLTAAGDRGGEISLRPGYGFVVPADIATTAGATAVDAVPVDQVPSEPAPQPEPQPADPAPEPEQSIALDAQPSGKASK